MTAETNSDKEEDGDKSEVLDQIPADCFAGSTGKVGRPDTTTISNLYTL